MQAKLEILHAMQNKLEIVQTMFDVPLFHAMFTAYIAWQVAPAAYRLCEVIISRHWAGYALNQEIQ